MNRLALFAFALVTSLSLVLASCVSKSEFERMKEEIAAAKGDIDKLQKLAAQQAVDLRKLEGAVADLRDEIAGAKDAAALTQEKAQNKATGAKPKAKKKKKK